MTNDGPAHVVVVEDNPSDVRLVKMALQETRLEFLLESIEDGAEALAYFNSSETRVPDLVVLDLNLPKVEGPEILHAIRSNSRFSQVAVAALSSSSARRDIERITRLGADCYLIKPADLDAFLDLGQAIRKCMEEKKQATLAANPEPDHLRA